MVVELRAGLGFFRVAYVLTEVVDRGAGPEVVHGLCGADRIGYRGSGDETARSALSDTGLLGDVADTSVLGKGDQRRSQHRALSGKCPAVLDRSERTVPVAYDGIALFFTTVARRLLRAGAIGNRDCITS